MFPHQPQGEQRIKYQYGATNTPDIASTRWGPVVVFDGDNWFEFYESCVCALASAEAIAIVQGDEVEPKDGSESELFSFKERRGHAMPIINSGVNSVFRSGVVGFLTTYDVVGMWKHLKSYDCIGNRMCISNYQRRIPSSSGRSITDLEVISHLIKSTPQTATWEKHKKFFFDKWVLQDSPSLHEFIVSLSFAEPPVVASAHSLANSGGHGARRSRGKGRRGGRHGSHGTGGSQSREGC
ncbi:hypothetical protein DSL72_007362 [Monilinia vaccinii-corymbosi]|uniref:Uncharacterized protein n=1 Tax=Monilinia vaccinii-corymbosi TaxID=61207 RepID=A0A8A3PN27_9HELO|nr:hypothetical protein DSL72_007362 [Monilinia vaccinii-corymbosi]